MFRWTYLKHILAEDYKDGPRPKNAPPCTTRYIPLASRTSGYWAAVDLC